MTMTLASGGDEYLNVSMARAAESMLREGVLDGLVRQLQAKFPKVRSEAEAAVAHGVHKLITRSSDRAKPADYVAACAYNQMKRVASRAARFDSLDAMRQDEDRVVVELADDGWTVEERALLNDVYLEFRSQVETWETGNVRTVTLLYLEAAYLGEPLPSDEAAERVEEILGEPVDPDFVRTWKSRGLKRLRTWVSERAHHEGADE